MLETLKNRYFFMRHGESEANVAGIIVSNPTLGCQRYGLTQKGRLQVKASVENFKQERISIIISSDFLRARQTADIVAQHFQLSTAILETGLRERWFGKWDGHADIHYQDVWLQDENKESTNDWQVESVEDVLQRGLNVIRQLETQYQNETILLVSHGDMLQILRTAFEDVSASEHRSLEHHRTAQIISF